MQNTKDTFYEVLRARLAIANPERTVVVRGLTRPGVLVVENELVSALTPVDCFLLRWGKAEADTHSAMVTVRMVCEISYATAGTAANGGMDRGRALSAMDEELLAMVRQAPQSAVKTVSSAGNGSTTGTAAMAAKRIWWSDAAPGEMTVKGDRMQRTAAVSVMSLREAGEL